MNKEKTNNSNKAKDTLNKEVKKLPLSSDIVFKRVFSKEENRGLLKSILEAIDRNEFYLVTTAANEAKKGEDYYKLKKTITIALLCENIIERNSYFHTAHMKFEPYEKETYINMGYEKEQEKVTDKLEMIFVEIPKFIARNPRSESLLNQWLWLIAGREEKIKMAKEKHEEIEKAIEVIDEMSMDPKEWELYESRRRAQILYNWDMSAAKEEGIKERRK